MADFKDIRWSGAPAAVEKALKDLGDPRRNDTEQVQADARVIGWGPTRVESMAGQEIMFCLLRIKGDATLNPPPGVFVDVGMVNQSVTGEFIPEPKRLVWVRDWFNRVPPETQAKIVLSLDVQVRLLFAQLTMLTNIDLDDKITVDGVAYLKAKGIITEEERLALLS